MPKYKAVYIHFESKPALERLGRYFAQYDNYQKIFATSYSFRVPSYVSNDDLKTWARECFPYDEYVICYGGTVRAERENMLFRLETQDKRDKFFSELDGNVR